MGQNIHIFVLKDVFSKLVTLYPIKGENTTTCLEKLTEHYFNKVGVPKQILLDRGT